MICFSYLILFLRSLSCGCRLHWNAVKSASVLSGPYWFETNWIKKNKSKKKGESNFRFRISEKSFSLFYICFLSLVIVFFYLTSVHQLEPTTSIFQFNLVWKSSFQNSSGLKKLKKLHQTRRKIKKRKTFVGSCKMSTKCGYNIFSIFLVQ